MSVVFVRRWLVAFFVAIGIILIVILSLRKVSFLSSTNVTLYHAREVTYNEEFILNDAVF